MRAFTIGFYHETFSDMRERVGEMLSSKPEYKNVVQSNLALKRRLLEGINSFGFSNPRVIVDGSLAFDMSELGKSDADGLVIVDHFMPEQEKQLDEFVMSIGFSRSNMRLISLEDPPSNTDNRLVLLAMMIKGKYLQGEFNPIEIEKLTNNWNLGHFLYDILDTSEASYADEHYKKYSTRLEGRGNGSVET